MSPDRLLSDGTVLLRPLREEDAPEHLAGEDAAIARWLSGGRSTPAAVREYIRLRQEDWARDGARRAFGVFDCATGRLIGCVEVNLAWFPEAGRANLSYGVFPAWRGRGVAAAAIQLVAGYLSASTSVRRIVLRIAPENRASIRVAEKLGARFEGLVDEAGGGMMHYAIDLPLPPRGLARGML